MTRFVLLRHECPDDYEKPSHWDLMFEQCGVLRTWELRQLPAAWARALGSPGSSTAEAVAAVALPDHRVAYLDFEGPLNGDRGSVRRCDGGEYLVLRAEADQLRVRLAGALLHEEIEMTRHGSAWRLTVIA